MIIKIANIPREGLPVDIMVPPGSIDTSDINEGVPEHIHFKGEIAMVNRRYFVSGKILSPWKLTCARCLKSFTWNLDTAFRTILTASITEDAPKSRRMNDEMLDESILEGDEIDLGQILREQMILHLPMKPICSDQCRGLCPECGRDLNEGNCECKKSPADPQLMKLRNLLDKRGK